MGTLQTTLLSDPSDYTVADDNTIEVQPLETLGHYADWLGLRTQRLRDINGFAFRTPVEVGQRVKLEFGDIDAQAFEGLRVDYHRGQQDRFFRRNVITGVTEHTIRSGESIWILSLRQYDVPVWLFRQYNPELDLHRITPGTTVRFPTLVIADPT
jgi:membrane-bound lytic murein transglycosylase D